MAAFVLAQICNGYREGQESCLQMGLHRTCCMLLSGEVVDEDPAPLLQKWLALCLAKLCEGFVWARYLCLTEAGHTKIYPLLVHPDPAVRASAVLALGEFLGASAVAVDGGEWTDSRLQPLTDMELLQLRQVELQLSHTDSRIMWRWMSFGAKRSNHKYQPVSPPAVSLPVY